MTTAEEIRHLLDGRKLGVLATQADGQPHASLMAFTPIGGIERIVLATLKATRKYESLLKDGRAALMIGCGIEPFESERSALLVTAHGRISDVPACEHAVVLRAHLDRHPEFEGFLSSPDCALLQMDISCYQLVRGAEQVCWCNVESLRTEAE